MSRKSIIEIKTDNPKSPLFATREQAIAAGKGCTGIRVILVNGVQMFAPCPPAPNGFEKLGERGIAGIETLPDGGLVSGKAIGRAIGGRKPSMFDGDGDGFTTDPVTGRDTIPAVKKPKKRRSQVRDIEGDLGFQQPRGRDNLPFDGDVGFDRDPELDADGNGKPYKGKPPKGSVVDNGYANAAEAPKEKERLAEYQRLTAEREAKEQAEMLRRRSIFELTEQVRSQKLPANLSRIMSSFINAPDDVTPAEKLLLTEYFKQKKKDTDITEIDDKGFVSNYSRSTDPDVFSDPDSARVRARNLGCIGIRSYIAKDGKKVYLPCTNSSDYNKYTGLRHDGAPMKKKSAMSRVGKRKMRTILTKPTKPSVPKEIDIDSQTVNTLAMKVRQHNSGVTNKPDWAHTNLRVLKDVYIRGNKDGKGFARVNEFLKLVRSGTADSGYHKDDDLLDSNHPWLNKPSSKK